MSGRGRGISNAPAWMTRSNDEGVGGNPAAAPAATAQQDAFGRAHPPGSMPPSRGSSRGPPPRQRPSFDDQHRGDHFRGGRYNDRGGPPRHDHRQGGPPYGGPPRGRGPPPNRRRDTLRPGEIRFRSFEEERDWVEDRRRKRKSRKSKFDQPPTAEQLATDAAIVALSNPAATDFAGIPADRNFSAAPQQTRHARRLYIGNLPPNVTEQELHDFFRGAIHEALVVKPPPGEDPILSVYINHERRFCFLEFKTVEMATACMILDGIDIRGKGKVKVKRPNDYNPTMAPKVHPTSIPQLDVSQLGIISGTVQDGPNKIFIGGLHYHLSEAQVLELLQAFGKVKSFHLVKNEADAMTSKGYCFVEYSDPNVTQVAVIGLNGMDLGGGKMLTARVAGERAGASAVTPSIVLPPTPTMSAPVSGGNSRTSAIVVGGYDVEELVDAAMGLRPMPTAPTHMDQFGMPLTQTAPIVSAAIASVPPPPAPNGSTSALPVGSSALDIANAALDAAFGSGGDKGTDSSPQTRILVLLNMVADEDLASDEEYNGLLVEVRDECAKYGKLLGIKIPRSATSTIQASAIKKIFLEYATIHDSSQAKNELAGRQFGPNVVEATFFDEGSYKSDELK